jgi:hypothetical protein
MKVIQSLIENATNSNNQDVEMQKSRSFESNLVLGKTRGTKNSLGDNADLEAGRECASTPNIPMHEDELANGNGTNSSISLTASTNQEQANKLRSEDKSNEKLSQSKIKDEQSPEESSDKSDNETKEHGKPKKLSNKEKERLILRWIKELSKLEGGQDEQPAQFQGDDDMPRYCSNKSCPISEHKILKIPKVLNLTKTVSLRKVLFQDHDERWYCLKCLDAHQRLTF